MEPPHMNPEEFRRAGHRMVDWLADYLERIEDFPVLSQVEPGSIRDALPPSPPTTGEPFEAVLADLDRIILPGITHWQSPGFFGYFPANASGPAILGELASAGLGVQGMLWTTSPAATELETHVLDWLAEMTGLPERFRSTTSGGGVIQDSASSATLVATVAARERATDHDSNRSGTAGRLTAYTSTQGHSSIEKAVKVAGIGSDQLRTIGVDGDQAMRPDVLEARIRADLERGYTPALVVATVGTTASTAIDPIPAIAHICRRYGVWLHVDAAYAGTAAILPEMRWILDGLEGADSYCFNPHKWMLTNFDCDAFYVADRAHLIRTLSVLPEYLRNQATESGAVIDYRDWQIPLGRRFRALKLWFVIRHYGIEGIRAHVRRSIALADRFASYVEAAPDFELAAPHPFGLVCFRHTAGDDTNRQILERVNGSGKAFLTHAVLNDRYTLRLAVGSPATEERHIDLVWRLVTGS